MTLESEVENKANNPRSVECLEKNATMHPRRHQVGYKFRMCRRGGAVSFVSPRAIFRPARYSCRDIDDRRLDVVSLMKDDFCFNSSGGRCRRNASLRSRLRGSVLS